MEKLNLNNITLICIEGTENSEKALLALEYSSQNINFKEILLISPSSPPLPHYIKHCPIDKLTWNEYNEFITNKLHLYFTTEYCILIQTDGFIINPHLWKDEFLKYDYIGAAWNFKKYPFQTNSISPKIIELKGIEDLNRVGNGGFTLRSKKLLEAVSNHSLKCSGPEDTFICHTIYDDLVSQGLTFAPVEIADIFSKDPLPNIDSTFGFHGEKNFINQI